MALQILKRHPLHSKDFWLRRVVSFDCKWYPNKIRQGCFVRRQGVLVNLGRVNDQPRGGIQLFVAMAALKVLVFLMRN